jgi:hypothetical protein
MKYPIGAKIAGVALVIPLGAGLLSGITDYAAVPRKNLDRAAVQIRTEEKLPSTETVDLRNGNLHLQIPIPATRKR